MSFKQGCGSHDSIDGTCHAGRCLLPRLLEQFRMLIAIRIQQCNRLLHVAELRREVFCLSSDLCCLVESVSQQLALRAAFALHIRW